MPFRPVRLGALAQPHLWRGWVGRQVRVGLPGRRDSHRESGGVTDGVVGTVAQRAAEVEPAGLRAWGRPLGDPGGRSGIAEGERVGAAAGAGELPRPGAGAGSREEHRRQDKAG